MSDFDISEIIKRLFDLVEKTNTLTNALANVEKSLLKVEDYQVDTVKDNHESRMQMRTETNAIRGVLDSLVKVGEGTREDISVLIDKISSIKSNERYEEECKVCEEKQKAIDGLKKDLDEKEIERKDLFKTLMKWLIILAIALASALGLNFEPIRKLIGIG